MPSGIPNGILMSGSLESVKDVVASLLIFLTLLPIITVILSPTSP